MKTLLSITFFLLFAYCVGQTKHQKLIAAEFRIDISGAGNFTYLVSYNFADGLLISKDTILGVGTNKEGVAGSYVRYDLGKNFIYKNRYVISGIGNVIDIKTKSLVIKESDDFISANGDTLIFHRDNIFTGTGYLMLDLKAKKYRFINKDKIDEDKESRSSPDKFHYLSIDRSKIPYKIWLHSSDGKKKIVVNDAGHGPNITISSQFPNVETQWLNNSSFIYAVHEKKFRPPHKEFSKVFLRIFDIQNSSDKIFYILDSVGKGDVNGRFYVDKIGQTIYRTSGWNSYVIDTANSNLLEYPFYEIGYKFSLSNRATTEGTTIRFKNIEVGIQWCTNEVVSDKIIAMAYGEAGSNLGYPKGIKVWSHLSKAWTTIDVPWLSKIIGWVDEE